MVTERPMTLMVKPRIDTFFIYPEMIQYCRVLPPPPSISPPPPSCDYCMWNLPGPGSNLHINRDPSHYSDKTSSLPHCAIMGTPINPLCIMPRCISNKLKNSFLI